MNPLKRLRNLLPQTKRFYGSVISINGDRLAIQPLAGGVITIHSQPYAEQFQQNDKVWLTQDQGNWTLEAAPTFAGTETILI